MNQIQSTGYLLLVSIAAGFIDHTKLDTALKAADQATTISSKSLFMKFTATNNT